MVSLVRSDLDLLEGIMLSTTAHSLEAVSILYTQNCGKSGGRVCRSTSLSLFGRSGGYYFAIRRALDMHRNLCALRSLQIDLRILSIDVTVFFSGFCK